MQSGVAQGVRGRRDGRGVWRTLMQGCNASALPMIVSLDGSVLFANGTQTTPATLTAGQTLGLTGFTTSAV